MVAGLDGCRGGWYIVQESTDGTITGRVCASFRDALQLIPAPAPIAIDIPIGLKSSGARTCDLAARRALAPTRGSSVFPAPIRPVLHASTHKEASDMRRAVEGKGISIQSFNITGKIREVDAALRASPTDADRVYEVHPELCFASLNNAKPLSHSKKRASGRAERLALLAQHFGDAPERLLAERPRDIVAADDVIDAFVALWTARRIANGTAASLPSVPEQDELGLRMAIFT